MKTFILRLRLLFTFFSLIKNPTQTEKIFFLSDKSRELPSKLLKPTLDYIMQQPGFKKLFDTNYDPPIVSLEELFSYPEGTLGHSLGVHLKTNNLELEFFPPTEGADVATYITRRVRRTHDLWHVLTGFDTSPAGEVALQAFTFAQLKAPFSALLIAISILHSLDRGQFMFLEIMEKIFLGHRVGSSCSSLIGIPLEQKLGEDVSKLRTHLGLGQSFDSNRTTSVVHSS